MFRKGEEDDRVVEEDLNVDDGGETYEDVEEVCYPTLPGIHIFQHDL